MRALTISLTAWQEQGPGMHIMQAALAFFNAALSQKLLSLQNTQTFKLLGCSGRIRVLPHLDYVHVYKNLCKLHIAVLQPIYINTGISNFKNAHSDGHLLPNIFSNIVPRFITNWLVVGHTAKQ